MSGYKYYQPNKKDLKDKCGDCVIRALTKVMNKECLEIFEDCEDASQIINMRDKFYNILDFANNRARYYRENKIK